MSGTSMPSEVAFINSDPQLSFTLQHLLHHLSIEVWSASVSCPIVCWSQGSYASRLLLLRLQLFIWTGENHVFVLTFKTVYRIQSVPYVPLLWLVSDMGNTEARTLINLWLFAWQDAEGCGLLDSEKTPA